MELLKRKGERKEKDFYQTPPSIAKWIVERCIGLSDIGDRVRGIDKYRFIEPGCGDYFPFAIAAKGYGIGSVRGIDIRDSVMHGENIFIHSNTDFLTHDFYDEKFNIIATNPPFSQLISFWRKGIDILTSNGVFALLGKLSMVATKNRSKIWDYRPPAKVTILYPRPSFTGDGKTDIAQEYCVAFWYGEEMEERRITSNIPTILDWLNWKSLDA